MMRSAKSLSPARQIAAIMAMTVMICGLTGQAAANEPAGSNTPSAKEDARARDLFRLAESHYAAGRYEKAIPLYEEAYQLSGRPALLLAMANAHERIGAYDLAIKRLGEYIEHPGATNVSQVRERLNRLEDAERERQAERERLRKLEGQTLAAVPKTARRKRRRSSPLPSYLFMGGGALGLSAAVGFGLLAQQASRDIERNCNEDHICLDKAQTSVDRERQFAIAADISAGVGIAAGVVGVYLLLSRGSEPVDAEPRLNLTVLPGGLGVGVTGAF